MKKKIISLLLALTLCLCLALTVSAEETYYYVYDEAYLLTADEEAALAEKLADLSQQYNAQILVVTVDDLDSADVDWYLNSLYDVMGFGYGENHDGVMLMLSMKERDWRILSNGYAGEAITEQEIEWIGDIIVSDLSDGNYATAFDLYADEVAYYLDGYINGFPFDAGATLLTSLVTGLIVAWIVTAVLKGQLKSVRKQDQANSYIKPGSLQVTLQNDLYLYRNVTRTKKAETSSSGSSRSGGSRSTGGGKF